jgi:hypothetical protein
MVPSPHARVADPPAWCAVTHGTRSEEFVDLIAADEDWVRREFDAIVAAGWGGAVPSCPAPRQGAHWPRRPGYNNRPTPVFHLLDLLLGVRSVVRQRGPPL